MQPRLKCYQCAIDESCGNRRREERNFGVKYRSIKRDKSNTCITQSAYVGFWQRFSRHSNSNHQELREFPHWGHFLLHLTHFILAKGFWNYFFSLRPVYHFFPGRKGFKSVFFFVILRPCRIISCLFLNLIKIKEVCENRVCMKLVSSLNWIPSAWSIWLIVNFMWSVATICCGFVVHFTPT